MAKTTQVMTISEGGICLKVIRINDRKECNPYRVYLIPDRYHRKQVVKYADFMSCIYFIRDMYREGCSAMPMYEQIEWAKEYNRRGYQ